MSADQDRGRHRGQVFGGDQGAESQGLVLREVGGQVAAGAVQVLAAHQPADRAVQQAPPQRRPTR